MALSRYSISPLALGINTSSPELFTNKLYSPRVVNARIDQNSVTKRRGYSTADRTLQEQAYDVALFQLQNGTRYTLYLTSENLCLRETGTGGTWSYKTESVTTVSVTGFDGTKKIVTASGGGFTASGVAAGDYFIITADLDADTEPDTNWGIIASKDSDTQITLTNAYTGASATGACTLRKVYTVPNNERWSYAMVDDKFCFTNGETNVQYWTGTGYAAALDSTNAVKAKYCIEYANRLFLADCYISSNRAPYTVKWSKEGDPTDWTDSTAGENDFLDTDDYITGLGKAGSNIVVYKRDSIVIGARSGDLTAPVSYQTASKGIGLVAPWSLVSFLGTNAWLGRDDFYRLNGDYPVSIGSPVRDKLLAEVGETELQNTWGMANYNDNEIWWFVKATMGEYVGQKAYVWNYKTDQWSVNTFPVNITGLGKGAA